MNPAPETDFDRLQTRVAAVEPQLDAGHARIPEALIALNVLDTLEDAVCLVDGEWRFTFANARTIEMARVPRERLFGGETLWALFPGLAGGSAQSELERTMQDRVHARFDFYCEPCQLWFDIAAHPAAGGLALIVRDISARKENEQRISDLNRDLARRIREFETLLEVTPVGIGIASDPECRDIRANPMFAAMLGGRPGDNMSKTGPSSDRLPFRILSDGRELGGAELPMQFAAREGIGIRDVELEIKRADGTSVTELAFAAPLFEEGQRVRGSIGVFVDITERKRAQEALRASEERYRFLAEAMPQLVWTRQPDDTIDWANGHVVEYLGLHPAELSGAEWKKYIHPDDLESFTQASNQRARGEPYEHEFRLRRKDGVFRWMLARIRPFETDAGVRWLGTAIDIDDRRRMEQALRESEERLRLAAHAGKIGLWDWDIRNNSVIWSDRVYEFHDLAPGTFDGNLDAFRKLVHPADEDRVAAALEAAIVNRTPYDIEFRTIRPNGDIRWLSACARAIYDAAGSAVRMVGASVDSTERREAEEALRRTNLELEEFAYAASHDLQEPLRTVSLYSELLVRRIAQQDDPQIREFGGIIRTSLSRMDRLIRDLLAYSRIIHADGESSSYSNLDEALQQARDNLQMGIAEAAATIEAASLPTVRGEHSQYVVLFQNLLSNAIKYRTAGAPCHIAVTVERSETEYVIGVSDNGIGFDQAYAERIFGLFKRLHKDEYPGTGLGLAICRRIAERQGGRIWAESKPGEGARFYFVAPAWT